MNITYLCNHCERTTKSEISPSNLSRICRDCGDEAKNAPDAVHEDRIVKCVVCPSKELFVRKDFSQRLGVAIVVAGLAASCIPWCFGMWYATYGILFATALADILLYFMVGDVLECYRCQTQYRGVAGIDEHDPFQLEVFERHRQQAARLREAVKN